MSKLGDYEVHPFADKFPLLLYGEGFNELTEDIKQHGLREPIILMHDQTTIVDGRNRYLACKAALVDPVFEVLDEGYTETMVLDLIVSKNLVRRNLTPGQKSMLGAEYLSFYEDAAKEAQNQARGPDTGQFGTTTADLRQWNERAPTSAERAAKATGASERGVQQAKAVMVAAPNLAERVMSGTMALDKAYKIVKEREPVDEATVERRRIESEAAARAFNDPMIELHKIIQLYFDLRANWTPLEAVRKMEAIHGLRQIEGDLYKFDEIANYLLEIGEVTRGWIARRKLSEADDLGIPEDDRGL
jgi:hypothetical protein